ncbi:MAG: RNA polymerase sigma factor [Deltaproteobacteria bacterium]|nr:RNA polymerase sigma factor [Deltaproteobacteria bacterium]
MPAPPSPEPARPQQLDQATLEALYLRLEKPLFNAAFRWIWDAAEARDVVQEAFVKLWGMATRVDPATVEPLVWRLALNGAANRRRRRRLWQWLTLETLGEHSVPSHRGAADEQLSRHEGEVAIRAAVDGLPEKLKQVILMCEFSGMGYAQISQALGIPEGTVASRRNAALRKLEQCLGPLQEESP